MQVFNKKKKKKGEKKSRGAIKLEKYTHIYKVLKNDSVCLRKLHVGASNAVDSVTHETREDFTFNRCSIC